MWIVTLKSGKYKFVDNYKNPLTNRYQEVSCTFGKNNREVRKKAQMILDEKIRKKLNELKNGNTDVTFSQLVDQYLDLAKKQLAYNTWYRKKTTLEKIVREWGPKLIARKITSQYINKYLDNMLYNSKHPYTNETVNAYKSCISVVYDMGIRYGYITENPVDNVKVSWKSQSQKRREEIENKYLEDDEYAKILMYCDEHNRQDLKDLFIWMYNTGMRVGEVAGLQRKNILEDKDGHYFARVNGSLISVKNTDPDKRHIKTKNAKSFAGDRDVYLTPETVKLALKHCKGKKSNEYIFKNEWPTSLGYWNESKINKVLKTIASDKDIHKNLVTHIFRHSHVSKLAEQGWPLNVIQHRVGHGNSRITRSIYLHITKKVKNAAINRLNDFPDSDTILAETKKAEKEKMKVI